jgi:hypothetical protein
LGQKKISAGFHFPKEIIMKTGIGKFVDPDLRSVSAGVAITQLHLRLVEARKAETQREELEAENRKDDAVISTCLAKSEIAVRALNKLKELAKCDDDHQLETTITAAERKIEKQDEYDRISVGLIERNSLPDVRQIEEEASGTNWTPLNQKSYRVRIA